MQARFDFVTETGKQRLKDRDVATQHIIRKRATQAAAATKKQEGRSGRVNLIQYPPGIEPDDSTARATLNSRGKLYDGTSAKAKLQHRGKSHSSRKKQRQVHEAPDVDCSLPLQQTLEPSSPLTTYCPSPVLSPEQLVSLLPSLRLQESLIGRRNRPDFTVRDKNATRKIVRLTTDDFVSLLVDRYGQDKTLDAAIDCLGARTRELLGNSVQPISQAESPSFLYGRALRVMKRDIDNLAIQTSSFETKLAILALALYELLNSSADQMAWILHSNGAAVVLQKAGPKAMTSDLHKTFLMIIAPVVGAEAILGGRNCFLAQPDWQEAMASTVNSSSEPFDDRGELFVSLRMIFVCVPNLFNEAASIVYGGVLSGVSNLQSRLQMLKAQFSVWRSGWDTQLYCQLKDVKAEDRRLYALTVSLMCSVILDRLLIAIKPELFLELEESAKQLSRDILEATCHTHLSIDEAKVRVAFMADVAEAILTTSRDWEMSLCGPDARATIDPQLFADWCRKLGRPVPNFRASTISPSHSAES